MEKMKNQELRILIVIALITVFLTGLSCTVYATQEKSPDDIESVEEKASELLENYSPGKVLEDLVSKFKETFLSYRKSFFVLIFITFVLGSVCAVCGDGIYSYACEICVGATAFSMLTNVFDNISEVMKSLNSFILSMLPVMTTLYSSSVGPVSASMSYSSTIFMLNFCSTVFVGILIPAIRCVVIFALVTLLSKNFDFSLISKFTKSTVSWLFGMSLCVMSAVIYFQSVISVSRDGLASRAIRYAASSLIPVIGNVVSESARTVGESLKLVRGVTGVSGIFGIVAIIAAPILSILICKILFGFCGGLSKLIGSARIASFYNEIASVLNLLLGTSIGMSLVFILIFGMFAKVSVQV